MIFIKKSMKLNAGQRFLKSKNAALMGLIEKYPIEKLYFFGSVLTDKRERGERVTA